jgi:hypothetical protein
VVATDVRSVIVVTMQRRIAVEVGSADSATILRDGLVLITAPAMTRRVHQGREYQARAEHWAYLVEVDSGRIVDRTVLDVVDAGVVAVPHPRDGSVLLNAGMGQDGSQTYVARAVDGRLAIEAATQDVLAASFAPSGDRLLLMPHPSFDNEVSVLGWPNRRLVARLTTDELAIGDDGFDLYGCFLSDGRILLKTFEHGLLLCSGDLRPRAWVDLDTAVGVSGANLSTVLGVADDAFAVEVWHGNSAIATVWRIPPMADDSG